MDYHTRYGEITDNNYRDYIEQSCRAAKKRLDRYGITVDNVSAVSDYAVRMYGTNRYDEVEADYMMRFEHKRG